MPAVDPSPAATTPVDDARLCIACGYDLRGLTSDRCPECGSAIADSEHATIPWEHRRSIGHVRAYVRTAALATFHPRRLAANVARPVPWADAVAFRRTTASLVAIGLSVAGTIAVFIPKVGPLHPALARPVAWWAELSTVPIGWASAWLAAYTVTGAGGYWFHPRSIPVAQQNRAVALAQYASGPMLALALGGAAAAAWFVLSALPGDMGPLMFDVAGVLAAAAIAFVVAGVPAALWSHVSMLRHTTHCGPFRAVSLAFALPITWATLAGLFAVGLPMAWLWLAFVVRSLR